LTASSQWRSARNGDIVRIYVYTMLGCSRHWRG
jgi:hypothetical protein